MAIGLDEVTHVLRVSAPGMFDRPADFAAVRLTPKSAEQLLARMDLAKKLAQECGSFDEIVFFDAQVTFHEMRVVSDSCEEVVSEAVGEVWELGVVPLSKPVSPEELGSDLNLDVRRMHVEPDAVYWSGLFDDDSRLETARVSREVLERLLRGG